MDDAIVYVCDYDVMGDIGFVRYLPVMSGTVAVGDGAFSSVTSCIDYPGSVTPPICNNIRSGQCERRMCYNLEDLIQKSWFDPLYGSLPTVTRAGSVQFTGALVSGRARGQEFLRIYKPFNYESCYVASSAGKPVLQHADVCQVTCRGENGFLGTAVIQYKCVGASGTFALVDATTGIASCAHSQCQLGISMCDRFTGVYKWACEFLSAKGAGAPYQQNSHCAAAGSKIGHDYDQRCTLTCQPGYHIECANITAIGASAPSYMDKLVGVQSLG